MFSGKGRIAAAYSAVLATAFLIHALALPHGTSIMGILLLFLPVALGGSVPCGISLRGLARGIALSGIMLVPLAVMSYAEGKTFTMPDTGFLAVQAVLVAFPEEFFFRGFLQKELGNTYGAIVFSTALFSAAHIPAAVFGGGWLPLFSFFPGLVFGYIFRKTGTVIPGTLAHFLSNTAFTGFKW